MPALSQTIELRLQSLVGLALSASYRAADMQIFHFGEMRAVKTPLGRNGNVGQYALHIQCPWRIEGPNGIVTGHSDLWEPAQPKEEIDWKKWDYDKNPNLRDQLIARLLGHGDSQSNKCDNQAKHLTVEIIDADNFGGFKLDLSAGFRLVVFPDCSNSEDWRFISNSDHSHFVIVGGKPIAG